MVAFGFEVIECRAVANHATYVSRGDSDRLAVGGVSGSDWSCGWRRGDREDDGGGGDDGAKGSLASAIVM